jgi:pimeloyl-ACP methyl ester carboxylesterase
MNGRYIDIDGFNTWYLDEGSGPTVVLLHGAALAVDAEITWFRTIEALRGEFRLVAPDQVGFGRTDMPPGGVYWNRHRRVGHALALIERLGIRDACLVGHSEGAYVATRIAISAPHLASRLVIVTSGATAPYLGGDADNEWKAAAAAAYNDPSRFDSEDAFVRTSGRLSRSADPRFEAILRANYRRAVEVGQERMFREIPAEEANYDTYVKLQEEHIFPYLDTLSIPALLVWAEDDATVPVARGLKLFERIPGAEFHLFRDAAHNVMHDQAEGFSRLLRSWCAG